MVGLAEMTWLLLLLVAVTGCSKASPTTTGVQVLILREGICREGILWHTEGEEDLHVTMHGSGVIPCPRDELAAYLK